VPGSQIDLPALTQEDIHKLTLALKMGANGIMASFTQHASDISMIRKVVNDIITKEHLDMNPSSISLIAKIESVCGLENLAEIASVSDGVCIARGDLGSEIGVGKVGVAQKIISSLCNNGRGISSYVYANKSVCIPVMNATQQLDSMITHPRYDIGCYR